MSRSLRSRPLTLYGSTDGHGQQQQQPAVPQLSRQTQQQQQQQQYDSASSSSNIFRKSSRRQQQIFPLSPSADPTTQSQYNGLQSPGTPKEGSSPGNARRMSTAIGNNLRKRLSMRYAEPTALGPGGLSAVPQMPALPPQFSTAQGGDDGGEGADAGPGMAGIGLRAGRMGGGAGVGGGGLVPSSSLGDGGLQLPSPSGFDGALTPRSGDAGAYTIDGGLGGSGAGAADGALQFQPRQGSLQHLHHQGGAVPDPGRPSADRRRGQAGAASTGTGGWERLERFARNPAVDLNLLTQSKFDPEAYLRATLNNHSEDGLRDFCSVLEATQAAANSDLRRTIFRNYKDFINISKEVSTLENDMLELKELLTEWRQLPDALQLVDVQAGAAKVRKGTRGISLSESATDIGSKGPGYASGPGANNQSSRMINDLIDDLAVRIALREWENAADLVDKGKETLASMNPNESAYLDLSTKLSRRISELVSAVSLQLSSPVSKKSTVVTHASIMIRLGQGEKARELFLEARTELLRKRTRMIKFEGDVGLYISELALVYFTVIKNTSEWYMSAFKENWMASGYVKWAAAQIQGYAEIFRRQVFGVADQDRKVIQEAMEITRSSAAQLKEVGLDFGFLIEELLKPSAFERPIPSLTLTLADDSMSSAHGHRASFISNPSNNVVGAGPRPTGSLISAQERRRTIMLAAGTMLPR
ncbi:exocyst complex component exo84 [Tilletia horrida]|uniref:Exocyst complex component exo84 n=1 Tax=Tilletia horrida TaxID=155126 RepID=A0AAN6GV25_9BASI|nr:exocyst complex component exo84 [Tilletia horrida]KAK0557613.1 exocyst complex component exo84 [Tilletia horrida]